MSNLLAGLKASLAIIDLEDLSTAEAFAAMIKVASVCLCVRACARVRARVRARAHECC